MNIQTIPLNKLVPSDANVRKTGAGVGIDELAASIAAHGLLQNLQIKARSGGKFEVVAGARRLAALKLLVKQKAMAKDAEIPCHVLDDEDAGEISLAENTVRLAMHPADQLAAFHALALSGKGDEEIAARFGVTASVVKQRLKLATVSPTLIDLYRDDEMSLDQLMAFTVSDNHEAQEAAWFDQPEWQRQPNAIRRTLTEAHVETDDARALFVGLTAYQAAGGQIVRDLFHPDHEGYLTDPTLLDRLVAERLTDHAALVQAEGWRWVENMPDAPWDVLRRFKQREPTAMPLSPKRQEERDRLVAELDALVADESDAADGKIAERMEAVETRIDAIDAEAEAWLAEDKAVAGAIVTIGRDGTARIIRGLVRPDDVKASLTVIAGGAADADDETAEAKPSSPLSARLIEDLTGERTAALRAMMADNESVALVAVAHAFALPVFYPNTREAEPCLDLLLKSRDLRASAEQIGESGAAILLDQRLTAWLKRLPEASSDLFGWLLTQDAATITGLIALCAATSIDAVRGKSDRVDCQRLAHADELADALGLDMATWWEPTKERYLGRVSKALILVAVEEGVSKQAAENLASLKKDALIERAAERLKGKGWLPSILRKPSPVIDEADDYDADPVAAAAE